MPGVTSCSSCLVQFVRVNAVNINPSMSRVFFMVLMILRVDELEVECAFVSLVIPVIDIGTGETALKTCLNGSFIDFHDRSKI